MKSGAVLWLGCILFLTGCGRPEPPVVRLGNGNSLGEPTMLFEGFQMVSTHGQGVEWKFIARAAQIYEKANTAKAQDIKIVYWKNGKLSSTLTAQRALVRTDTNDIRAEKNVMMVSEEGVILKTERLNWNQQMGKMYTDQPVTVEREGSVLTGVGLKADSGLKQVEILAHVHIQVPSLKRLQSASETHGKPQP